MSTDTLDMDCLVTSGLCLCSILLVTLMERLFVLLHARAATYKPGFMNEIT